MNPIHRRHFRTEKFDFTSFFFSGLTGLATLFILGILAVILLNIIINGWRGLSWHFVSTIPKKDFFDVNTTGVLPMIVGTTIRVFVMTIFVLPVGVITAIYLTEYAPNTSIVTRFIRAAVNNLAGVPSIVFGLFGLGFFINFVGKGLDAIFHYPGVVWGQPALTVSYTHLDVYKRQGKCRLKLHAVLVWLLSQVTKIRFSYSTDY